MKRILFTLMLLAPLAGTIAQNVVIDRPPAYKTGLFMSTDPVDSPMIASADFFTVTERVALGDIMVYGQVAIQVPGGAEVDGATVFIFNHDVATPAGRPDEPGTALVEIRDIPMGIVTIEDDPDGPAGATLYKIISIPLTEANGGNQIILEPGSYWMSVCAVIRNSFSNWPNINVWQWSMSANAAPIVPVFIDPSNAAGVGATNWTSIGTIAPGFLAFAWTLTDEEITVGIDNNTIANLTVYPNPVNDMIHIQTTEGNVIKASLFDLTGKEVSTQYNVQTINVSHLSAGIYMLRVETSNGVVTKKIVKR